MGRPPKSINKDSRITTRFTSSELLLIKEWAQACGMCIACFARQRTLGFVIKPRLTHEEVVFHRQLVGMANNLNQLAKATNSGENVWDQVQSLTKAIDQLLEKLIQ